VHFCTLKKKRYRLQVRKAGQDIVYFSAEDPIAGRLDDDARSFLESLGRARLLCAPDFSLSDYTSFVGADYGPLAPPLEPPVRLGARLPESHRRRPR
jgi:hypothetical protein